jgi:plasmid stability protein
MSIERLAPVAVSTRLNPGHTAETATFSGEIVAFGPKRAGTRVAGMMGMLNDAIDMFITCEHAIRMSRMIQLRNVPDDLHQVLKARAAMEGMTLSDYLIAEVRRAAERPTQREMRERLLSRTPVTPKISPAAVVRAERDSR